MSVHRVFSRDVLRIDAAAEVERITAAIREQVTRTLRRRGAVLGLSGGVDSSVCAALCVRALGAERVFGLFLPERESSPEALDLGRLTAETLGIEAALEDIEPVLEAAGCYRRRDAAIRRVVPEYGEGWRAKLVIPPVSESSGYALSFLVVESPEGEQRKARLTSEAFLGVVAATNFKQRTRKMLEYYHADRLVYAVAGTPNRLEYDQGFFVKSGDGAADLKPIAHLYKTQVYQLAEYLGVPETIRARPPTTDTYSLAQSQEEFFFALPYDQMDLCLYGHERDVPPEDVARATGLQTEQILRVYRDIQSKRRAAAYLLAPPLLVPAVDASASPPS
ncbi:MAG: NAD(+) synthase [Planctomycetes bacterium]|nr:NAD(+) synthase [Planctomycetota bacterium]